MGEPLREELRRYLVAVAAVAVALAVSVAARELLGVRTPYFLFVTAVFVSAYRGGLHVGLFATVLSSATCCYFILSPIHPFEIDDPEDALVLLLFTGEGIALSLLVNLVGVFQRHVFGSILTRYTVALVAVLVAFLLKAWTSKFYPHDLPFLLFYTAVMVAVWCGGTGPGLLATGMSAVLAVVYFTQPGFTFADANPQQALRLMFFLLEGTIITLGGATIFAARVRADQLERQVAENRRRIAEQAALLDQARDAILIEDAAGRVHYWSLGAERMYGWAAAEALGRPVRELLCEEVLPSGERLHRTKAGGEVLVESRRTDVRDDAGRPAGCLVLNADVSERKRMESQMLRSQRMETIGSLTSGIAHDLGNILSPLHMGLSLLRQSLGAEDDQRLVDTLLSGTERGISVVRQLVGFVRGDDRKVRLNIEAMFGELRRFLLHSMPKDIEIRVEAAEAVWAVRGDSSQFYQILLNLCVNARDAMPKGGVLTLRAENVFAGRQVVRVRVSDTGTGIPPEQQAKVFEAFFTTKPPDKGTGLGLSTVKTLVEGLGGTVKLESEVGSGATFTIDLPAADASVSGLRHLGAGPPKGRGELILVIDDEASIRELARRTLEAEGYRVVAADSEREAEALVAKEEASPVLVLINTQAQSATSVLSRSWTRVLTLHRGYSASQLLRTVAEALK